jgi:hypothetical protein
VVLEAEAEAQQIPPSLAVQRAIMQVITEMHLQVFQAQQQTIIFQGMVLGSSLQRVQL